MKRLLVNVCANSLQTFNLGDKDTTFFSHIQTIYYLLYKINKIFPFHHLFPLPSGRDGVGFFRGSFAGLSRVSRRSPAGLPQVSRRSHNS